MSEIVHLQAWACRSPVKEPIRTSFGIMRDRPAVFLRLTAADGAFGWSEVFANWPAAGAEHRVNLLMDDVAPSLVNAGRLAPPDWFARTEAALHVRALQCGEFGPFRQVLAGLDTALWDMAARRANAPLAEYAGGTLGVARHLPAYASGIHIDTAEPMIEGARAMGFTAFKVKVGFDLAADAAKLRALASDLRSGERLFADANQACTTAEATHFIGLIEGAGIGWLEEPIRADMPAADWQAVARAGSTPLAGGENIAGTPDFDTAIAAGLLRYIQPDVAKWGGISGCLDVARRALEAGRVYCPHFLGGGIGLAASGHLLAAAGGPGLLEVDVNPNPLRDAFGAVADRIGPDGWRIGGAEGNSDGVAPGLGIETLPPPVLACVTLMREMRF